MDLRSRKAAASSAAVGGTRMESWAAGADIQNRRTARKNPVPAPVTSTPAPSISPSRKIPTRLIACLSPGLVSVWQGSARVHGLWSRWSRPPSAIFPQNCLDAGRASRLSTVATNATTPEQFRPSLQTENRPCRYRRSEVVGFIDGTLLWPEGLAVAEPCRARSRLIVHVRLTPGRARCVPCPTTNVRIRPSWSASP